MSVKTVTRIICDICEAEGPPVEGVGPGARQAKEAAQAKGWIRQHGPDYGGGSKKGMIDLCPKCKSR